MAIVFIVAGALVVFAIAAVLIGRETMRLAASPPRPVFDVDEAVVWIADRLPDDVTAELSHADVREVLLWSVEHLRIVAMEDRLADTDEAFVHVLDRAVESGRDWSRQHIRAVLDAEAAYLEVIGAAGRQELPPTADG